MTPRAEIFAAFRAAVPGIFSDPARISILDGICDDFGVPKDIASPALTLTPSRECADLIAKWEGMANVKADGRIEAYPDPATKGPPWTIGVGTTGPDVVKGTIWTREQCMTRFADDLATFGKGVSKAIGDAPTTQAQYDAMVSLAYNVGLRALEGSTLLKKHKAGDFEGAAAEFGKWINAGGRPLQGLRARRWAEQALYEGRT